MLAQKLDNCHNVHCGGAHMKLKRETYLEQIRPYYDSDIIKVITGVRRSGKSILLNTIKEELPEKVIQHCFPVN